MTKLINSNRWFLTSVGMVYLALQIGFFISFINLAPQDNVNSLITDKIFLQPLLFIFNVVLSIVFSSLLHWKYKMTKDSFYLKFSYFVITWSMLSQLILFQAAVALVFVIWSPQREQINRENSLNDVEVKEKDLVWRSIINLFLVMFFIALAAALTITNQISNWAILVLVVPFVYQIFFKMIINQAIDLYLVQKKLKVTKAQIFYLVLATTFGQFWYPMKLAKKLELNANPAQSELPKEKWSFKANRKNLLTRIGGFTISAVSTALLITTVVFSMRNFNLENQGQELIFSTTIMALMISQFIVGSMNAVLILASKYKGKIACGIIAIFFGFVGLFFWIFTKPENKNQQLNYYEQPWQNFNNHLT